jgi:hypothetical protein
MKRVPLLASLIGAALLLMLPATASASGYVFYGACGTTASAAPSHSCSKSSAKAAFFKSKNSSVTYTVCVKFPSGQKLCANAQSAPKGKLRHNTITSTTKGLHKITWKVGGTKVGTWNLTVT